MSDDSSALKPRNRQQTLTFQLWNLAHHRCVSEIFEFWVNYPFKLAYERRQNTTKHLRCLWRTSTVRCVSPLRSQSADVELSASLLLPVLLRRSAGVGRRSCFSFQSHDQFGPRRGNSLVKCLVCTWEPPPSTGTVSWTRTAAWDGAARHDTQTDGTQLLAEPLMTFLHTNTHTHAVPYETPHPHPVFSLDLTNSPRFQIFFFSILIIYDTHTNTQKSVFAKSKIAPVQADQKSFISSFNFKSFHFLRLVNTLKSKNFNSNLN